MVKVHVALPAGSGSKYCVWVNYVNRLMAWSDDSFAPNLDAAGDILIRVRPGSAVVYLSKLGSPSWLSHPAGVKPTWYSYTSTPVTVRENAVIPVNFTAR